MNLRWLYGDHVPAGIDLTDEERDRVRGIAVDIRHREPDYKRAERRSGLIYYTVGALLVSVAITLIFIIDDSLIHGYINLAVIVLGVIVWMYARHCTHAPFIWRALCEIGKPVCWECGDPLLRLDQSQACPECGWNRRGEES